VSGRLCSGCAAGRCSDPYHPTTGQQNQDQPKIPEYGTAGPTGHPLNNAEAALLAVLGLGLMALTGYLITVFFG
jgi:hypothetical protein